MADIVHRGKVVDENGRPLYQAHIITINSTPRRFAVSDQQGNFAVNGSLHDSFEITHIGYEPQIFRLDRFMADKTYRLAPQVNQLDEVVVSPRNPRPVSKPREGGFDLGSIFEVLNPIFNDNGPVLNTPPYAPLPTPKIPTITRPPILNPQLPRTTGAPNKVASPPIDSENTGDGLTDWIKENPWLAGGLLVGAILAGTALVANKGSETEEIAA